MVKPIADTQGETAVEFAVLSIKERIRSGDFVPGQRLVASDLVRQIGVSAGPVREAVRKLTGEGILEIQPNRGAIVRDLTPADIREIYEVREVVEGKAARIVAEKIGNDAVRTAIHAALAQSEEAFNSKNLMRYHDANHEFHTAIFRLCDNSRLQALAEQLELPIYTLRYHQLLDPANVETSALEHRAIMSAILLGDGPEAERVMRRHVRNSGELILSRLKVKRQTD